MNLLRAPFQVSRTTLHRCVIPVATPRLFSQMSSLCFYDAAIKRKQDEISEAIYAQSIAAHATGLRHGRNRLCNSDSKPENYDPEDLSNHNYFASNVHGVDRFASQMANLLYEYYDIKGNYFFYSR